MIGIGIRLERNHVRANPRYKVKYYYLGAPEAPHSAGDEDIEAVLQMVANKDFREAWRVRLVGMRDLMVSELKNPVGAVAELFLDTSRGFYWAASRMLGLDKIYAVTAAEACVLMPPAVPPDTDKLIKLTPLLQIDDSGWPWMMSEQTEKLYEQVLEFPDDVGFIEMCRRAGLDKACAFTYAELSETDFEDEDLTGYDFSGANLRGCDFSRAKVQGMIYIGADIDDAKWPAGYQPDNSAG